MTVKRQTLAVTAVLLMPVWAFAEDSPISAAESVLPETSVEVQADVDASEFAVFPDRPGGFIDGSPYLVRGQSTLYQDSVARFGWWGVATDGSPSGVGEWTGLNSAGFWDIDSLTSDGCRTVDFSLSGPMDETTDLHWYLYSPHITADVDFQRFIHRTGYKPLNAWFDYLGTPENTYTPFGGGPSNDIYQGQDYNETQDHAIRVQELDAKFSGKISEHVRWHMGVWGMRKFGERQATAMDHNCSGHQCHQVTQSQSINWLTMEVTPGIEVDMGPVTVDYTRTMRAFEQDDELVGRTYAGRPNNFINADQFANHAVVPENFTEIDKLKIGADLSENNRYYVNMFHGNTHNRYRDTDRGFWGVDMRLTNTTYRGLRGTMYAKYYEQNSDLPTVFPEDPLFQDPPSAEVRRPVTRQQLKAGLKGRWRPFVDSCNWKGLALVSGYEYKQLERQFVTYEVEGSGADPFVFTQPDTFSHAFNVGTEMRWSRCFDTYLRYRMVTTDDPLYGVRESDEVIIDDPNITSAGLSAFNTNQPTQEDRIELGGTWSPTHNFMLGAMVGFEMLNHRSEYATFDEDNIPVTLTAWYAPTCAWSLSGALGFYQNLIEQDITYGNGHLSGYGNEAQDILKTDYTGRSDVITLASHYVLTKRVTLNGDFQFVRGQNTWYVPDGTSAPPPPTTPVDFSELPTYSAVIIETTRFGAGFDYELGYNANLFFKYMYYDYQDKNGNVFSGSYHSVLGGLAARF